VDFESDTVIARLTAWDSGEWKLSANFAASQEDQNSDYRPAHSLDALIAAVSAELRNMKVVR
jgi:hypothetical protein